MEGDQNIVEKNKLFSFEFLLVFVFSNLFQTRNSNAFQFARRINIDMPRCSE